MAAEEIDDNAGLNILNEPNSEMEIINPDLYLFKKTSCPNKRNTERRFCQCLREVKRMLIR